MKARKYEILRTPIHKIYKIEFSLLSPEFIKRMAVVEITRPDLYDTDGFPIDGGIMDPRLGVIEPGVRCKTCGCGVDRCLGHWGYVELAKPVFHIKFIKHIYNILKATCPACGRVTIEENLKEKLLKQAKQLKEKYGENHMWMLFEKAFSYARKVKKCPYCGEDKPNIELKKPYYIYVDGTLYLPEKVREWLEKIPDEDLYFICLHPKNRPEWMVLTVLPVPPVTIRPSITLETGLKSEDDLTHKLADIVRFNQKLKELIQSGSPLASILEIWKVLQYHVATYLDNSKGYGFPIARTRAGKVIKSLTQRIEGKEGILRHNLGGKRVNFSARAVIIPDPWIYPDEVGVPEEVAKELTYPVRVTSWNKEYLKRFIENGPDKYPGANYIIDTDGVRIAILPTNKETLIKELKEGQIVERHMLNGDLVLFNRQPSLHRISIMAHRVRILPGKVFRINPVATIPYNADFDGDEMNLHLPQTEEAQAELKYLMEVKHHIVTQRYGLPIIGAKQDFVLGAFLLTESDNKLYTKEEVMYFLGFAGIEIDKLPEPAVVKEGVPYWTGRQIYSLILPKIDYEGKTNRGDKLVIKDGVIIEGVVDSKAIGAESGFLFRKIVEVLGEDKALEFLHRSNLLALAILAKEGSTVSLGDMKVSEEVMKKRKEILEKATKEVFDLIEKYEKGLLEALPGESIEDTLRNKITEILNRVRKDLESLIKDNIDIEKNNIAKIAISGARGKILNLVLILASLGQQTIRGDPITRGYRGRTLPHFKKGTKNPMATGFVISSYKDGLNPIEYFMHSAASRSNLMEKTRGTPTSGYFYRRMVNATYDLKVEYDYTVRDEEGNIIQFTYGEDGLDVTKTYHGDFDLDSILSIVLEKIRKEKIKK